MGKKPNGEATRITVLVVEDQTAIREMLAAFVSALPEFTVVAQAGTVSEAIRYADALHPDLVVLDWMLIGGGGLDFIRQLAPQRRPKVLVFSANTTELAIREALAAGANGYVEKTASFADFKRALLDVAAGKTHIGSAVASVMQRVATRNDGPAGPPVLSPRERDVLRLMAEGKSSKEIAGELGLSVRTVDNHRASIMRRTGLKSIAQLTLHAVRLGLVTAPVDADVSDLTGHE